MSVLTIGRAILLAGAMVLLTIGSVTLMTISPSAAAAVSDDQDGDFWCDLKCMAKTFGQGQPALNKCFYEVCGNQFFKKKY